jgi:hypothetical protein
MKPWKSTPILFCLAILAFTAVSAKAQYSYQWLDNSPYGNGNLGSGGYAYGGGTPIDGFTTPICAFDSVNSDTSQGIYAFDLSGVNYNPVLVYSLSTINLTLNYASAGQPWNLALSSAPNSFWNASVSGDQLQLTFNPTSNGAGQPAALANGVFYLSGPADVNATISYSGSGSWDTYCCGANNEIYYKFPKADVSFTMAGTFTTVPESKSEGWLAGSLSLIAVIALTNFKKKKSGFQK